ncbi:hypothetical protein [Rhizobium mongolense]|nr:hypothetical protein [Rhizobium mongolense]
MVFALPAETPLLHMQRMMIEEAYEAAKTILQGCAAELRAITP